MNSNQLFQINPMHIVSIPGQTATATLPELCDDTLHIRPPEALALVQAPESEERAKAVLKRAYLECRKDVKSGAETLRQAIVGLLDLGIPWQQLVLWAKSAGRNDRYTRKLT